MQTSPTDLELMKQMSEGQTNAFDCLYFRHGAAIHDFLLRMLGDRSKAEDLMQECFVRVWRARFCYVPTASFRTWLFTIARRLALDARKHRSWNDVRLEDLGGEDDLPTGFSATTTRLPDPARVVIGRGLEAAIEEALDRIPDEYREIVLLREREELSYAEIAAVLECPIGTVKSRLNGARRRLRALLKEWLD